MDVGVITASLAKVHLQEVFITAEEQKTKEFKLKSITGKCPVLETEQGYLVESAAIARYIARMGAGNLAGSNPKETSEVDQWIDIVHNQVQTPVFTILKATFGWAPVESDAFNAAIKDLKDALMVLNTHLQGKDYLVGNRITVADVVAALTLLPAFQVALEGGFRKAIPNLSLWLERFTKISEVVARLGHVKFCQKIIKPVAPSKKEEKKEEKKAAPAKKEEDEEEAPKEKKLKNPLDSLPPSNFVLPDFKTFFVNNKDKRNEGMARFWGTYDPEGYSLYFAHYDKYEGEGVVMYQTANLMNGFLQRLDNFRAHVFSMMAIVGEEPNLEIESVWLFRGKGIPEEMTEHPQWEYYTKRELDINKDEDKKLITDFFCAKEGDIVNGLKVQQCKMHK